MEALRTRPRRPAPPHAECLRLFYARDRTSDGRFLVGVTTTGIYCLPSCPARRPRPENVRILADEAEARAAGLRACKRCRPDLFARGGDPGHALARELGETVRARPGDFADIASLARTAGIGATRLTELFRLHWHASPAAFLSEARVEDAARRLAGGSERVLDAGLAAGFESSSALHAAFRRRTGLAPGELRDAGERGELLLRLPPRFRAEECLALLARGSVCEHVGVAGFTKALHLGSEVVRLEVELARGRARLALRAPGRARPSREAWIAAHRATARMLGLATDPGPFERRAQRLSALAPLVATRPGLRVPLTADLFEALVWVVVGQQVTVAFAAACRDALIERAGASAGDGLVAHPTPAEVARLERADLVALRFSRRKAEVLLALARSITAGELDLERLAGSTATDARAVLLAVDGLGPWSAEYVLLRGLGFADCAPAGDAGLSAALRDLCGLDHRPDAREVAERMEPFAPHRSLATFHLWRAYAARRAVRSSRPGDRA